jgi:hypothetical protein
MNDLDLVLLQVRNKKPGLLDHVCIVEARERKIDYRHVQTFDLRPQNTARAQRSDVYLVVAAVVQQRRHLDHLTLRPTLDEAVNDL